MLDIHRHLFVKFGRWEFFPEIRDISGIVATALNLQWNDNKEGSVSKRGNRMPGLKCPKALWDGIGSMLDSTVFLVQDQPLVEDDIWLMYDILGGLQLLGRLNRDCELYMKALPLFRCPVAG